MMFYKFDFSLNRLYAKGELYYEKLFDESDLFRGKITLDEINGKIILGKGRLGVYIFCGWAIKIVRDDFKNFVEKNSFTGVNFEKVNVESRWEKVDRQYYLMSVNGKSGKLFCKKDKVYEQESKISPKIKEKGYQGIYIEMEKYDGSDFFSPEDVNYLIIKKYIKDKLIEDDFPLQQIEFEELNSFFVPEYFLTSGNILLK